MRNGTLLAVALIAASFGVGRVARAQDAHDAHGSIVLEDLPVAQRQLAIRIWGEVVCSCPRENWSRALLNCPDSCADAQKQEILAQVGEGMGEQEILDAQRAKYGPRVIGKPDDALTYLLPVLMLVVSGTVVALVFGRWRRAAAVHRAERSAAGMTADDEELAAVERELEELR